MSDLDMHLKTKEQKMKGKLTLHASVHHHGADHKRGHYTFRFYDLENFRVKIIDDSKITEESFKPEDEQITTLDSYMILYKFTHIIEQPPSLKDKIEITNPNSTTPKKTVNKRGRKPKHDQKDDKQRSLAEFFPLNKIKEGISTTSHKNQERDFCSIVFSNIRSLKANKTALEVLIERNNPKILALIETWMSPSDPKISLKHDYYEIFEQRRNSPKGAGGIAILVDKYLKAFQYETKKQNISYA